MSTKKVYLAVGHGIKPDGRYDPGARSVDGEWTEQSAGDIVVAEAQRLLEQAGVVVVSEAYSDDPAFEGSIRTVNTGNYNLAVTIHHDWNKAPSGGFGFWHPGSLGKAAADAILGAYKRAGLPTRDSWHKARQLAFTSRTRCPAVLWECGRVGEYDEQGLRVVGRAVAEGIAAYLGVPLDAPEPAPRSTATTPTEALTEIKDHLGIKVGQVWNVADYRAIVDRVRKVT